MRRWILLAAACHLRAQAPPSTPVEIPARIGILGDAKITLSEVIQRVLANDPDIAVSRIVKEEAVLNLRGARGVFDPRLGFTGHDSRVITPATSSLSGATNGKLTQKELLADPSLSGATPVFGGTYKLDFSSARQQTDSTFNTVNPQYPVSLALNLTQPLWRGLMYDDNRHRIEVAKKNVELSEEQFRQKTIERITLAVQSYRELEFAYRNFAVQTEGVRLAERQDAGNRRQVEQGLLAPVDVVQTQTQIATFRQNLFAAQSALTAAENALKVLMLPDRSDLMWGMALIPDGPPEPRDPAPPLEQAVKQALAARPELKEAALSIEVNRLDSKLAHDQTKPQVDAYAMLSANGIAGQVIPPSGANPFAAAFSPLINQINALSAQSGIPPLGPIAFGSGGVPPLFVGGYGQALSALGTGHFTTAVVGVNVSLPLRNRTATAAAAVDAAEERRLRTQRRQMEMLVEQDVRNALQAVASAEERLHAATDATRYSDDQYQSEQRQFQAGASTVFLVLQRQTGLIAARTQQARAEADLGEARANLDRALGRTIEKQNVSLRTP